MFIDSAVVNVSVDQVKAHEIDAHWYISSNVDEHIDWSFMVNNRGLLVIPYCKQILYFILLLILNSLADLSLARISITTSVLIKIWFFLH